MKILMGILFVFIAVVPFAGNAIGEQVYNVQIPTLAREHHLRSLALQTGTRLIAELHDCHSTRVFHRVFRFSSASRQEIYAAYFGPAKIKWSYNDAENILKVTDTRGEPPKQSFYGIALAELNFHPRNSHSLEYEFRRELDKSEEIQALLARTENAGGLVFHELNWDGWPIDDSEPVPQFAPPACFYFESCAVEDVVKRAFEIGHAKGVIFKSLCKHKECGDHAGGILYFFSRDVFNPRLDIRKQLRKARGPLSEYGYSRERHVLVTTLMFRLLTDERNTIRILEEDGIFQDDTVDLNLIKDELWAAIAQSGTELSQEFLIREFKKNKEGLGPLCGWLPDPGGYAGRFTADMEEIMVDARIRKVIESARALRAESKDEYIDFPAQPKHPKDISEPSHKPNGITTQDESMKPIGKAAWPITNTMLFFIATASATGIVILLIINRRSSSRR